MMQQQVVRSLKPLWCNDGCRVRGGGIPASPTLARGEQVSVLASSPQLLWKPPCSTFTSSPPFSIRRHFLKSPSTHRRTILPQPCCHSSEMEIISVKELADGFIHLSFGASANACKVDELSSSHGELMSVKIGIPRPKSRFKKQLPFPVVGVRRKKRQTGNLQAQETSHVASSERTTSLFSRPKSCFVKRSPIPVRKSVQSGQVLQHFEQSKQAEILNRLNKMGEGSSAKKAEGLSRPRSNFAKRSPVPMRMAVPATMPDNRTGVGSSNGAADVGSSNGAADAAVKGPHLSRPKSKFSRRSPVVKLASQVEREVSSLKGKVFEGVVHKKIVDMGRPPVVEVNLPQDQQLDQGRLDREVLKTLDLQTLNKIGLESVDLEKLTVKMLRNIARSSGVKGFSKLNKRELVERLAKLRE